MDERTLTALKGSIAKWEAIVEGAGADEGQNNCPLCEEFALIHDCEGCPVAERVGTTGCVGTPYQKWKTAAEREFDDGISDDPCPAYEATTPKLIKLAQAELDFLRSLLPTEASSPASAVSGSEK